MKKIVFLLITMVFIYFIYQYFNHTSINFLIISDNHMSYNYYLYDYLKNKQAINEFNPFFTNYNASLIYQDIKNNRTIRVDNKDYYFKKSLRESDFVIIDVGMEELSNNYTKYDTEKNNAYFGKMYGDIEKLVKEIRKYAQEKVIYLGLYNPTNYYDSKTDEFFYNVDSKLDLLMKNNNVIYIKLYELVKSNNYQKITDSIIFYLD